MAKRNRRTLKNFFKKGQRPKQEDFSDLIDSMVNIVDEGFTKSIKDGLEIGPINDSDKLMSFFQNIEDKSAAWSISTDKEDSSLSFNNNQGESILALCEDGNVGINTPKPKSTLDVNGILSYKGKQGNFKQDKIPADGKWHNILSNLDACQAFELMAGVGKKKFGKYALLHAYVLSTFNSKNEIFSHQSYFNAKCNCIKLKWSGEQHNYSLLMRSRSDYGENIYINYSISQLWFDPYMDKSLCINDEV